MKKLVFVLSILSLWMVTSVSAQSVKKQEAVMEDFLPLLQASGYQVYSFDLSDFLDDTYYFKFRIKEYVNKEEVKGNHQYTVFPNRIMLDEFPEDSQRRILEEGRAEAPEKGVYKQAKKLTIGFMPSKEDSLKNIRINMEEMGEYGKNLNLKPLKDPQNGKLFYHYESRPFAFDKFEEGKFIPLVFFASYWLDEQGGFFRFCGAMEVSPGLESDYVEDTPHFYVIGVEINKKK